MGAPLSRESIRAGVQSLLDIPVSFFGLAFFRSWVSLLTHDEILNGLNGLVHDAVLAASLLVFALLTPRIAPISSHRKTLAAGLLAACASSAMAVGASAFSPGSVSVAPLVALLAGFASSAFILQWCELYSRMEITRAAAALSISFISAVAINLLLDGMTDAYRQGALIVLPCLTTACFLRANSLVSPAKTMAGKKLSHMNVPWQLLCLIGMYQLASGICVGATGMPSIIFKNVANAAAGLLLLAAVTFLPNAFDLKKALRSPAVIFACVLLLFPFVGTNGPTATAALCTSAGSAFFEIAIFLTICDISHSRNIPAMFLFALEEATVLFQSAGIQLGAERAWLAAHGVSVTILVAILIALAAILTLLFFETGALETRWGIRIFGPGKISRNHEDAERLKAACASLSQTCGFTSRETEVLDLLARGMSLNEICSQLSIARGTAKAHCEHIYAKAGVHSRKELMERLDPED